MKRPKAPTFADLPDDERALIRSVLNALNRAKSFEEANTLALHHKRHDARPRRVDRDQTSMAAELAKAMNEDAAADPKHAEFWDQYFKDEFTMLRESLKHLARHGKLPDWYIESIVSSFEAFVVATPMVEVSRQGYVSIRTPLRFTDAQGAAAFAILRLAQLSSEEPAILCCEECETFALILPSVGSRMSRFCSTTCRNRWGQRKYRQDHPKAKAARHK